MIDSSLPNVYEIQKLGDLVYIKTGKLDANASSVTGEYPFFTCSITPLRIDSYSYDCECVLVAGNGDLNVKYYNGKFDAYQRTYIIESKDNLCLDTKYLYYFMSKYVDILRNQSIGGVIKYIKLGNLTEAKIPVPPLETQKKIVEVLEKSEKALEKRKEANRLLDEYLKSVFVEMFGNPLKNDKAFELKTLSEIATINRGKFTPRPRNNPIYYNGEYPFIQTGDISNCDFRLKDWTQTLNEKGIKVSKCFNKGTIVVAIVGATIGATAILERDVYAPDSVIGIVSDNKKATSEYIEYVLRWWKPVFLAQAPATARANINLETLKPIGIPMPPINEQMKFSKIITLVYRIKEKNIENELTLNNLFNVLMKNTFNGTLKL